MKLKYYDLFIFPSQSPFLAEFISWFDSKFPSSSSPIVNLLYTKACPVLKPAWNITSFKVTKFLKVARLREGSLVKDCVLKDCVFVFGRKNINAVMPSQCCIGSGSQWVQLICCNNIIFHTLTFENCRHIYPTHSKSVSQRLEEFLKHFVQNYCVFEQNRERDFMEKNDIF